MDIPDETVPKYFEMDPQTDDLVPSAMHLVSGVIVLAESDDLRVAWAPFIPLIGESLARAQKYNRWCRIENLKIEGDEMSFIGVYHDGTKRFWTGSVNTAWYIKIDSFPDANSFMTVQQLRELDNKVDKLTEDFIAKLRENDDAEENPGLKLTLDEVFDRFGDGEDLKIDDPTVEINKSEEK